MSSEDPAGFPGYTLPVSGCSRRYSWDLKENQISKIEKILEELDQRRQEYRQEIRKMRTESISRMEKELTPEQQRKFEQLQEEWEGRKNKRRSTK